MGIVIALFAGLLIGGFTGFIITERIAEREDNYDKVESHDIHDL